MYIGKAGIIPGILLAGGLAVAGAWAESVDPTLPIDYMPPPPGMANDGSQGISVNMVLVRGNQAVALVNGRHVRVNDLVGGAKVVAIGRNFVELQQNGSTVKHYLAGFGNSAERLK